MTNSSVSSQGFTHKNDTCDTSILSHRKGSPQRVHLTHWDPLGSVDLKSLFIGITGEGPYTGTDRADG